MFDLSFIGDVIGDVVDVIGNTNWTSVLSSSVMPSLIGAGVGALASAVTDGDMTDGLLFGAAGGLVAGGLLDFGSQFANNWSVATNPTASDAFGGDYQQHLFDMGIMPEEGFTEFDKEVISAAGITLPEVAKQTVTGATSSVTKPGASWWDKTTDFLSTEGGAQLALGGASFLGNLLDDSPTEGELMERHMDEQKEARDRRRTALASFNRDAKTYTPSTAVPQVVQGLDKEEAGVNLGGNVAV